MKLTGSNMYIIGATVIGAFLLISLYSFNPNSSIESLNSMEPEIDREGLVEHNENQILTVYASLSPQAKKLYFQQSDELTEPVPERLVELDELTIGCFGTSKILQMPTSDKNLGGQCCGVLKDFEAYKVQLEALRNFISENGSIDLISKDPYDISVEHAQKLITFDKDVVLSSGQQQIYNDAVQMSHHGGPCCCKCWKWYMMSGLGKKLIVDHGFNSEQLAELWDLSSSCGHDEDTNMPEHYETQPDPEEGDEHTN